MFRTLLEKLDLKHAREGRPRTFSGLRHTYIYPEFIAKAVREWIVAVGARSAFIEPGSPWENGYCESFNSKLRDELLNAEIFYVWPRQESSLESWRGHYNTERPHSSLGYRPPAPEAVQWPASAPRPSFAGRTSHGAKPVMH